MFTKAFALATAERAIKTFVQSFGGSLLVATTLTEAPWLPALNAAALATVLSVLTSVGSASVGEKGSPSIGPEILARKVEAVVEPASPSGAVAGEGSDLPEGTPVEVEPYVGRHAESMGSDEPPTFGIHRH